MSDHSQAITVAVVGAVGGAVVAFLLFTDRGRKLRKEIELVIEETSGELNNLRAAAEKATGLAMEGWKLLNDAIGEGSAESSRYSSTVGRQSLPF